MSQGPLIAALSDPSFYPHRPARVEHVQTHISHVFLAGSYVYKLKKAVTFPFLDFSTLEARRRICDDELRLNRRLSPAIYLDVIPVVRAADGRLTLGGAGELVEPVLRMRRLPEARMLPALLARGAVDGGRMARLAAHIAAFHAGAPTGPAVAVHASPESLRRSWDDTIATLAPFVGSVLPPEEHEILADFGRHFVAGHEAMLRARQAGGHVRDGHGDLHAEHVCFVDVPQAETDHAAALDPGIYVFDCIEFSTAFRCNDVASEIAFLAMDLERRGRRDLAEAFTTAYVAASGDAGITRLLPYYVSARACVRAMVECLTSAESEIAPDERASAVERAGAYARLAVASAWRAGGLAVIACAGLSGTGKSALAAALAGLTDAVVLRSDVLRKRAPVAPADRYAPAARAAIYEALAAEADAVLAAGRTVIADATFIRRADRDRLAAVAARRRCPYVFLECRAPEPIVRGRLAARTPDDVSDARWETYVDQRPVLEPIAGDEPCIVIDTGGETAAARRQALHALWDWRRRS